MPMITDTFELRRQSDGLVYRFDRTTDTLGRDGFKRQDADLWIIDHPRHGWIAGSWDSDDIFGRPWIPSDHSTIAPPEGVWVSRKDAKSYVYDLVYL